MERWEGGERSRERGDKMEVRDVDETCYTSGFVLSSRSTVRDVSDGWQASLPPLAPEQGAHLAGQASDGPAGRSQRRARGVPVARPLL